jgi:hypothetical protein
VLEQGGTANAWNVLVHEIVDDSVDYLVPMDVHIELADWRTCKPP